MKLPSLVRVALLSSLAGVAAFSQPAPPPVVAQFKEFFTAAPGEWRCLIREWDGKSPEPVWQDWQLRRFEWNLMNEFLIETAQAWIQRSQRWVTSGLHLFGVDAAKGTVVENGYWAGMSAEGFRAVFTYDAAARELRGTMEIAGPDGKAERRRCVVSWEGDKKFFFRVYRAKPDGSGGEYLHEELAYERGAFPPPEIPAKS
jgi:hypothetical protein